MDGASLGRRGFIQAPHRHQRIAATSAIAMKTDGQLAASRISAPVSGAATGTMLKTTVMRASSRAAASWA